MERGLGRELKQTCCVPRYRLAAGTSEKIQLSSLIAAFQVARDMVTPDS